MSVFQSILKNPKKLLSPRKVLHALLGRLFPFWMRISRWVPSDRFYLKVFYYLAMHKKLDLNTPKTYTQKIQWLKLHNTNPLYSKMVDKYEVREIIIQELGEEYLIPLLGVWDQFDEIDFEKLPHEFVLKTTHDSGSVIVCKDKAGFDHKSARKKLTRALQTNYFYKSREYPYKNAIPRIIAEKFMHDESQEELIDYKFFCFHGKPIILQITQSRNGKKEVGCFNMEFQPMPFYTGNIKPDYARFSKPFCFEKMVEIAEKLSRYIVHVRIDLYCINDQVYFGEYTFHNAGGIVRFSPPEWNKIMGDMIELPLR